MSTETNVRPGLLDRDISFHYWATQGGGRAGLRWGLVLLPFLFVTIKTKKTLRSPGPLDGSVFRACSPLWDGAGCGCQTQAYGMEAKGRRHLDLQQREGRREVRLDRTPLGSASLAVGRGAGTLARACTGSQPKRRIGPTPSQLASRTARWWEGQATPCTNTLPAQRHGAHEQAAASYWAPNGWGRQGRRGMYICT